MHAQHFVDNQTIHHVHRSSPFVFRSQVVYRHTDSVALCERTPAFCVGRVPVWVTTESSEHRTTPSRKASASIPARIYIRMGVRPPGRWPSLPPLPLSL